MVPSLANFLKRSIVLSEPKNTELINISEFYKSQLFVSKRFSTLNAAVNHLNWRLF